MENNYFINIENYNLSYGSVQLFENFDFKVEKGCCGGIFGPTGTGKTSLLNKIVEDYIGKYKIAYVFQDNKLIENLTAIKNVMLPIENLTDKATAEKKAKKILESVNLDGKGNKKVSVLSGGERQRVNIARAFCYLEACNGDILLMDEPFSAQDEENRENLIELTKRICKENKITAVIVSHNREDLYKLCNENVLALGVAPKAATGLTEGKEEADR